MAKKGIGPKEAQLRTYREGKAGTVDLDGIKQRLQELEAKKHAELVEERNHLLAPLHEQAEAQHQIIKAAQTTLDDIEATIASVTGETRRKRGGGGGGTRKRSSPEELKERATAIVAFVKSHGKDGIGARAIVEKFGKVLPAIKTFVQQHAGVELKKVGDKAATVYSVQ